MKKCRWLTILATLALITALSIQPVFAADGTDTEPNNTMASSDLITFRGTGEQERVASATGYVSSASDDDFYKLWLDVGWYGFTLTNNDTLTPNDNFGSLPADYDVVVWNSSGSRVTGSWSLYTEYEQNTFSVSSAGYYYFQVDPFDGYSTTEKYKLWITEGDAAFDMEGLRYRYHGHGFYGRLNSGGEYHSYGVAYSYGGKDSRSTYESKMDEANAYAAQPLDNWSDYSSGHPRPGCWKDEYDLGLCPSSGWAGMDCSGLIWEAAHASDIHYTIENTAKGYVGVNHIMNNSTAISFSSAKIGDVYAKADSHITYISRLASSEEDVYIIHAASMSAANGGRRTQESHLTDLSGWNTDYDLMALNTQ